MNQETATAISSQINRLLEHCPSFVAQYKLRDMCFVWEQGCLIMLEKKRADKMGLLPCEVEEVDEQ